MSYIKKLYFRYIQLYASEIIKCWELKQWTANKTYFYFDYN